MSAMPVRLQRSRKKGAKLISPNGLPVVCVTRGTKWGNPFKGSLPTGDGFYTPPDWRQNAMRNYISWIRNTEKGQAVAEQAKKELRGCNLACWCKPGDLCHADVLLEIANQPEVAECG